MDGKDIIEIERPIDLPCNEDQSDDDTNDAISERPRKALSPAKQLSVKRNIRTFQNRQARWVQLTNLLLGQTTQKSICRI